MTDIEGAHKLMSMVGGRVKIIDPETNQVLAEGNLRKVDFSAEIGEGNTSLIEIVPDYPQAVE